MEVKWCQLEWKVSKQWTWNLGFGPRFPNLLLFSLDFSLLCIHTLKKSLIHSMSSVDRTTRVLLPNYSLPLSSSPALSDGKTDTRQWLCYATRIPAFWMIKFLFCFVFPIQFRKLFGAYLTKVNFLQLSAYIKLTLLPKLGILWHVLV